MMDTPTFTVEKVAIGYRVTSEPDPLGMVRRFFPRGGNKGFSKAVGYASRWAAEAKGVLVDRTGRLSEAECAALVDAQRT